MLGPRLNPSDLFVKWEQYFSHRVVVRIKSDLKNSEMPGTASVGSGITNQNTASSSRFAAPNTASKDQFLPKLEGNRYM